MVYPENMDFELSLPAVETSEKHPQESFLEDLFKIDQTTRRVAGNLRVSKFPKKNYNSALFRERSLD